MVAVHFSLWYHGVRKENPGERKRFPHWVPHTGFNAPIHAVIRQVCVPYVIVRISAVVSPLIIQ